MQGFYGGILAADWGLATPPCAWAIWGWEEDPHHVHLEGVVWQWHREAQSRAYGVHCMYACAWISGVLQSCGCL